MGEMQKPSKYGTEKEFGCSSDTDCADTEKCIDGNCTNPCSSNPCPSGEFCLNEGNHFFTCVECTSNEQCEDREICKNNSCIDACYGDPCASKKQSCSSQSGHTYICFGCTDNNACSNGKVCDTVSRQCVCPAGTDDDGNGGCKSDCPDGYELNPEGKCAITCQALGEESYDYGELNSGWTLTDEDSPCKNGSKKISIPGDYGARCHFCSPCPSLTEINCNAGYRPLLDENNPGCYSCVSCSCGDDFMPSGQEENGIKYLTRQYDGNYYPAPSVGRLVQLSMLGNVSCNGRPCFKYSSSYIEDAEKEIFRVDPMSRCSSGVGIDYNGNGLSMNFCW